MSCIFCDIVKGSSPASFIYRDEICSAFIDIQPVNPGHILVIPNEHTVYLNELPEETGAHLYRIAHKIIPRLKESELLKCEGVTLLVADGKEAGQEIFHTHLHIIPRFSGDEFGFRFGRDYYNLPGRETLDALAGELKF